MNWTKDKPTKPGWYWCYSNYNIRIINIWWYGKDIGNISGHKLFTNEDGGALLDDQELYGDMMWMGPLEEPEIPK